MCGGVKLNRGKDSEAIEHAKMLKEIDPASGHHLLGLIYAQLGNIDMAKEELESAVKINPKLSQEVNEILEELHNIKKE